jgi:predicted MPP superfamily phosphohydrolase
MGDEAQSAVRAGADLIVSGHTHGGQIWPFSILTKLVFTYHHGLYKLERGYILTTSGIGTWGPPMRLGAPPEIVLINLVGENEPATFRYE